MLITCCASRFLFLNIFFACCFNCLYPLPAAPAVCKRDWAFIRTDQEEAPSVLFLLRCKTQRKHYFASPSIGIKMQNIRWLWAQTQAIFLLCSTRMGNMILTNLNISWLSGMFFRPYSLSNQHYTWPQTSVPVLETSNPSDSGGDPPAAALHWGSHCATPKSAC